MKDRLMECGSCGKRSNRARWIGEAILTDGRGVRLEGIVSYDGDTDCLSLDPLIDNIKGEVEDCTGEVHCTFCWSKDFY